MSRFVAAVLVGLALSGAPATGEVVCRPDTLKTTVCQGAGPRPEPRPPNRKPARGLEQVLDRPAVGETSPGFIPARRTEGLGGMVIDGGTGPGLCRPDALGNLNCR